MTFPFYYSIGFYAATIVEQLQLKDATGNKTNEVIVNKETESYSF